MTPPPRPLDHWLAGPGLLVTGTDTGIGKTTVACELLRMAAALGRRTAALKPIATGAFDADGESTGDAAALRAASTIKLPPSLMSRYRFARPTAPEIAFDEAASRPDPALLTADFARAAELADFVIVEGAGGYGSPLGPGFDHADLARAVRLPVVLVVGLRLGAIGHARLARRAIQQDRIAFAGYIINRIEAATIDANAMVACLERWLGEPALADFAFRRA